MAQSGNARAFEAGDEVQSDAALENDAACPVCGSESRAYYSDRYGSYEFCKDCGWSDEAGPDREVTDDDRGGRRDRGRRGRDDDF